MDGGEYCIAIRAMSESLLCMNTIPLYSLLKEQELCIEQDC